MSAPRLIDALRLGEQGDIMKRAQKYWVLALIATIGIMAAIIFFSAQSEEESNGLSEGLARVLLARFPVLTQAVDLNRLNHWLRKTAHFTLYFFLGCGMTVVGGKQTRVPAALLSILAGTAFAASDEIHQFFSDGRGPMVQDVFLDAAGIVTGTSFLLLCRKLCGRKKQSRD